MNDELDPGLRRLFASTAETPADEAFVAAVTARTSREGRIMSVLRPLAGGLLLAVSLAALAIGLGVVLNQSRAVIAPLVNASPVGLAAGLALAFAGMVCVRTLTPIFRLVRFYAVTRFIPDRALAGPLGRALVQRLGQARVDPPGVAFEDLGLVGGRQN